MKNLRELSLISDFKSNNHFRRVVHQKYRKVLNALGKDFQNLSKTSQKWPSSATVSNWVNGKHNFDTSDREKVIALLCSLFEIGGIENIEQANQFLSENNSSVLKQHDIEIIEQVTGLDLNSPKAQLGQSEKATWVSQRRINFNSKTKYLTAVVMIVITAVFFIDLFLKSGVIEDVTAYESLMTVNGVEMMYVPAGCFQMGFENGNPERFENIVHTQCIEDGFWIDRYEVSNEHFGDATEEMVECDFLRNTEDMRAGGNEPQRARNCVTWTEANAHCAARGARLPTEIEWEYAARGPQNLIYPWGNEFEPAYANVRTATVGRFSDNVAEYPLGISWVGVYGMSGGVWEWTSSLFAKYPLPQNSSQEQPEIIRESYILRGGSWDNFNSSATTYLRGISSPDYRFNAFGFRCAMD